jgi:hypothetical protein
VETLVRIGWMIFSTRDQPMSNRKGAREEKEALAVDLAQPPASSVKSLLT